MARCGGPKRELASCKTLALIFVPSCIDIIMSTHHEFHDENAGFTVVYRTKGRRAAQRAINKRDRKKQAPVQEPADARTLLLVLGGLLLALFLVTKMALGL
jgi:hypothetical protein